MAAFREETCQTSRAHIASYSSFAVLPGIREHLDNVAGEGMALFKTHDMEGDGIGGLPRLTGFRAAHLSVAEKVHQY